MPPAPSRVPLLLYLNTRTSSPESAFPKGCCSAAQLLSSLHSGSGIPTAAWSSPPRLEYNQAAINPPASAATWYPTPRDSAQYNTG